jgi:hypothetical protein
MATGRHLEYGHANHAATLDEMLDQGLSLVGLELKKMPVLHHLIRTRDETRALRVIQEGKAVDLDERDTRCRTALHHCAELGLDDIVMGLLSADRPLDLNAQTQEMTWAKGMVERGGLTPLHLAAAKGHTDIVRGLLTARAVPDPMDQLGFTPRMLASVHDHGPSTHLLEEAERQLYTQQTETGVPTPRWRWPGVAFPLFGRIHRALREDQDQTDRKKASDRPFHQENDRTEGEEATLTVEDYTRYVERELARRSEALSQAVPPFTQAREIALFWSPTDCQQVLQAVTAYTNEYGWNVARHRAYPTTDIPCWKVAEINAWVLNLTFPRTNERTNHKNVERISYIHDDNLSNLTFLYTHQGGSSACK